MNGITLARGYDDDGKSRGVSSLSKPKYFKQKSLNKTINQIPLYIFNLNGKISEPLGDGEAHKELEMTHDPPSIADKTIFLFL